MAFVATCMDKAMGALMEGVGTAKKGVKKVPDYAPSTEKGQNRLTYLYMTIATVILLVRFTDFDISIVQAISSMCMFMSFVRRGFLLLSVSISVHKALARRMW